MGSSSSSFPGKTLHNNQNEYQMERTWGSTKIGNFNEENWLQIFQYLNDVDLVNVGVVCKTFEILSENVFKTRHTTLDGQCGIDLQIDRIGWKPVVCRFRNVITTVQLRGRTIAMSKEKDALCFIEDVLSETLQSLVILLEQNALTKLKFRKKFVKLNRLLLFNMNLTDKRNLIHTLNHWCPNLNELTLIFCKVSNEDFFRQSLPSLEILKLHDLNGLNSEYLWTFFSKNNHLKDVSLESSITDDSMSWLRSVNELLINVERLSCTAHALDTLPPFRANFDNLKSLSFLMKCEGTYHGTCTDDLLQIANYLPKIEIFRVVDCLINSITNEGLLELIDRSSSTLMVLFITSFMKERALKFDYDLHRKIYGMQSTSNICIQFKFGDWWGDRENEETIKITKERIWVNHKLIVVASMLQNH